MSNILVTLIAAIHLPIMVIAGFWSVFFYSCFDYWWCDLTAALTLVSFFCYRKCILFDLTNVSDGPQKKHALDVFADRVWEVLTGNAPNNKVARQHARENYVFINAINMTLLAVKYNCPWIFPMLVLWTFSPFSLPPMSAVL